MEKIKYNKDDLVRKLSQKLLFSNEDMKFMVDNFLETILEILKQPKDHIRIELRNFGIFEVKPTKAKPKARNPRTNEEIFVPAHRKIMFKPGKNLKTELKKEWKI
ncbi:MAG: HU family DNA-binding protein [Candidatus Neomarinimicrobiota bacterium]